MEGMIGEIRMFAGNFAPRSWALCAGQLVAISSNTALFSIIGCTYGGDCRTTFAIPDLRGRCAVHAGSGPGLTPRQLGERGGAETALITQGELPSHTHPVLSSKLKGTNMPLSSNSPADLMFSSASLIDVFTSVAATKSFAPGSANLVASNVGGTQSHNNMAPYVAMHYIMAMQGVFPSRN